MRKLGVMPTRPGSPYPNPAPMPGKLGAP